MPKQTELIKPGILMMPIIISEQIEPIKSGILMDSATTPKPQSKQIQFIL